MRLNRHYLWLLWLIPVALGLGRLRLDTDILDLLPSDVPSVQGLKLYQQHFANARELVVTVQAPSEEQTEAAARIIATQLKRDTARVASVTWQPPWLEQPELVAELLAYLWLNQPTTALADLTNRLAPDRLPAILDETKEFLSTSLSPFELARLAVDPYSLTKLPGADGIGGRNGNSSGFSMQAAQRMFSSDDGTFRLLYVRANEDLASYQHCTDWLNAVQAIVQNARISTAAGPTDKTSQPSGQAEGETIVDWAKVVVRYTGRPAFVSEMAAGMQRDMSGSVIGTALIICALFWLAHRRWAPLVWLLALLGMILVSTLALGGLVLGHVNVVSLGFAAILLGLAVDYAVVHYQEAVAHPDLTIRQVRRAIAPSIVWAAFTTICAFLTLNLGGLPGLAQLGSLVAIGIGLSAVVMVTVFLPPLFRKRLAMAQPSPIPPAIATTESSATRGKVALGLNPDRRAKSALLGSALSLAAALTVLAFKTPAIDSSANALRPTQIEADAALEEIKTRMGLPQDPMWLVVKAESGEGLHERLLEAEQFLTLAVSNHTLSSFVLPSALCPRQGIQAANRPVARHLAALAPLWLETARNAGFEEPSLALTRGIASTWLRAAEQAGPFRPTNTLSSWILDRCFAQSKDQYLALGLLYPSTNVLSGNLRLTTPTSWPERSIWLSGWQLLGAALLERVSGRLVLVLAVMIALVLTCLLLAFGLKREVLLSVAVLGLSILWLLGVMSLAGWSWNLLNLMALPLVLGTGVDYSIFIQLALRRHQGDLSLVRQSVGRALMLCGGTAVAGFASLAWSGYPGMASLGLLCAVGIGSNMVISVWLLPWWWRATATQPA